MSYLESACQYHHVYSNKTYSNFVLIISCFGSKLFYPIRYLGRYYMFMNPNWILLGFFSLCRGPPTWNCSSLLISFMWFFLGS